MKYNLYLNSFHFLVIFKYIFIEIYEKVDAHDSNINKLYILNILKPLFIHVCVECGTAQNCAYSNRGPCRNVFGAAINTVVLDHIVDKCCHRNWHLQGDFLL